MLWLPFLSFLHSLSKQQRKGRSVFPDPQQPVCDADARARGWYNVGVTVADLLAGWHLAVARVHLTAQPLLFMLITNSQGFLARPRLLSAIPISPSSPHSDDLTMGQLKLHYETRVTKEIIRVPRNAVIARLTYPPHFAFQFGNCHRGSLVLSVHLATNNHPLSRTLRFPSTSAGTKPSHQHSGVQSTPRPPDSPAATTHPYQRMLRYSKRDDPPRPVRAASSVRV